MKMGVIYLGKSRKTPENAASGSIINLVLYTMHDSTASATGTELDSSLVNLTRHDRSQNYCTVYTYEPETCAHSRRYWGDCARETGRAAERHDLLAWRTHRILRVFAQQRRTAGRWDQSSRAWLSIYLTALRCLMCRWEPSPAAVTHAPMPSNTRSRRPTTSRLRQRRQSARRQTWFP